MTFKPEDNITCEQAIKIVVCALRYDNYKKQELNNEEELKYPDDYIAIAKEYGITDGLSFELGQNATRGFLATLISKSIDIPLVEEYIIDESKVPNILWKKFGFKIVTLLQIFFCLLLALIVWFVVKYANMQDTGVEAEAYFACDMFDPDLRL